jgi:SAM-dependent methyltransferase
MTNKIVNRLRFTLSRLEWHDLKNVEPVSRLFGLDRGTPIDRYYINNFLAEKREYITGKVLEVADNFYSEKYGTNVTSYEVLNVVDRSNATIVGDLTKIETLPLNTIDCFICTQVLNFIFDFQKAVEGAYHMLKPGGVMLATVGGISQISRYDANRWGHYWGFYPQGIAKAFEKVFGLKNVDVHSLGNSLSAISFIEGIAAEELEKSELDFNDQDYPVTITIFARKDSSL